MANYLISSQGEMKEGFKAETEWILAGMRSRWEIGSLENLDLGKSINWDTLLELCHQERVSPLIYALTRDKSLFPEVVQKQLQDVYHQSLVRNTHLLHELEDLVGRMAIENIPVMLIKGAALIESVYENPALRPMADLDLLIPSESLDLTQDVLEEAGYESSAFQPWPGFNQRYRQVIEYHKQVDVGSSFLIDLHWGVLDIPYYEFIPVDDLFARAKKTQTLTYIPAIEDHVLILSGHLGLHDRYAAPLIRYYDLALLVRQAGENFAWGSVLKQAEEWQLVIPLQRAVWRLQALWPEIVPDSVARSAAILKATPEEHRIHSLIVDRQRNPTSDVLFNLATMPGLAQKTKYLFEQGFPSPAYMRWLYCPQRPYLWPLTYFLRAGIFFQYLARARHPSGAPDLNQSGSSALPSAVNKS